MCEPRHRERRSRRSGSRWLARERRPKNNNPATPAIADRSEGFPSVFFRFLSFFHFFHFFSFESFFFFFIFFIFYHFFIFSFFIFFVIHPLPPPPPRGPSKTSLFLTKKLNFKARFWVREEDWKKKEERKNEERADRNKSLSTKARTGSFSYSRAWKPLTPTKRRPRSLCRH